MNAQTATQYEQTIEQALTQSDFDRAERWSAQYLEETSAETPGGDLSRSFWFRARAWAAQTALDGGFLRRAVERLQPLLTLSRELPTGCTLPDGLTCRLWLYEAEARARLKEPAPARKALDRALALTTAYRRNPLFQLRGVRTRLMLGDVRSLAGELAECRRALAADHERLVLLLGEEGRAWEETGELARAESCWDQARRLLQSGASGPIAADVYLHLGRLQHLRGHLQKALDCYAEGLRLTPAACRPQSAGLRLRQALVHLEINQWQRVDAVWAQLRDVQDWPEELQPLLNLVRALCDSPDGADGSLELQGYQASRRGDWELARALYRRAVDRAVSPLEQARLALALGCLALVGTPLHDLTRAEAAPWLDRAEHLAREHDLPEVLWRVLQARGRVAAELDQDENQARSLFEEAVKVSEKQRRQFDNPADAAGYQLRPAGVTRLLLAAACRRGDAEKVFHYQELLRGRFLLDLAASTGRKLPLPRLLDLDRRIEELEQQIETLRKEIKARQQNGQPAAVEQEKKTGLERQVVEPLLERERLLEEHLNDRSRLDDHRLPALPGLAELCRALPAGAVYVAPSQVDDAWFFLVARRDQGARILKVPGQADALKGEVEAFRQCVQAQLWRFVHNFPLGDGERMELDGILERLGQSPLGETLRTVVAPGERLLWVGDGDLHGFPVAALRCQGRYFVADREIVHLFSGALLVHQVKAPRNWRRRWGRSLVVTEAPSVLPTAAEEGRGVAGALFRARILQGAQADLAALRQALPGAAVLHCACHAGFDAERPLVAPLRLPAGEYWHTLQWLEEPVQGLPLVALNACHSGEVGALLGPEVFGLASAALAGGVRAVLASLWAVPDCLEVVQFMWRWYQQRLTCDLATALARTQRAAAHRHSPFYWALFVLFGDAAALPAPKFFLWRWLAAWKQRRLERRFPTPYVPPR